MSRTSCSKRCGELSSLKVTSAWPLPSKYAASLTHVWISVGFPLLQSRNTEGYHTINHYIRHTHTHTHTDTRRHTLTHTHTHSAHTHTHTHTTPTHGASQHTHTHTRTHT